MYSVSDSNQPLAMFLSCVVGYAVDSFLRRGSDSNSGPGIGYMVTTIVMDIVLGFLAAIIVSWFSRQREFRADRVPPSSWAASNP